MRRDRLEPSTDMDNLSFLKQIGQPRLKIAPMAEEDIIDIGSVSMDDEDTWLYSPNSSEICDTSGYRNIISDDSFKSVNTRTYIRPRKNHSNMNPATPLDQRTSDFSPLIMSGDFNTSLLENDYSTDSVNLLLQTTPRAPRNEEFSKMSSNSDKDLLRNVLMKKKNKENYQEINDQDSRKGLQELKNFEKIEASIPNNIRENGYKTYRKLDPGQKAVYSILSSFRSKNPINGKEIDSFLDFNYEEEKSKQICENEPGDDVPEVVEEILNDLSRGYEEQLTFKHSFNTPDKPTEVHKECTKPQTLLCHSTPCANVENRNTAVVRPFEDTSSSDESSDITSKKVVINGAPEHKNNLMNTSYVVSSPITLPNTASRLPTEQKRGNLYGTFLRRKSEDILGNDKLDDDCASNVSDSSVYSCSYSSSNYNSIAEIKTVAQVQELHLKDQCDVMTRSSMHQTGSNEEILSSCTSLLSGSDEGSSVDSKNISHSSPSKSRIESPGRYSMSSTYRTSPLKQMYAASALKQANSVQNFGQLSPLKTGLPKPVTNSPKAKPPLNTTRTFSVVPKPVTNVNVSMQGSSSATIRRGTVTRPVMNRASSASRVPAHPRRDYAAPQRKASDGAVNSKKPAGEIARSSRITGLMLPPPVPPPSSSSNTLPKQKSKQSVSTACTPANTTVTSHIPRFSSSRIPGPRYSTPRPSSVSAVSRK